MTAASRRLRRSRTACVFNTAELGIVEDGFFEFGVGNLAIRHGCMSAAPGEQGNDKDRFGESHPRLPVFRAGGSLECLPALGRRRGAIQ